jgi:hypothetical protein
MSDDYKKNQALKPVKRFFRVHRPGIVERGAKLLYLYCLQTGQSHETAWVKELAPLTNDEKKMVRNLVGEQLEKHKKETAK